MRDTFVRRRPAPFARSAHTALGILTLVVLCASPSIAAIPIPYNSTLPACIRLAGLDAAGVADPAGEVQVTVRDIGGNLIPNAQVIFDFAACPDIRFAAMQPFAGMHVECLSHAVWALSDDNGIARFRIVGNATRAGGIPSAGFLAARVFVDGVVYPGLSATAFDQDGFNGVGANDLALWLTDYFAVLPVGRSDYDASRSLGANDLAIWMSVYWGGGSTRSANTLAGGLCP